ncbi:MAG: hypothetical protein V5A88_09050 [Candidatus Thermoplasmatota archaeon]
MKCTLTSITLAPNFEIKMEGEDSDFSKEDLEELAEDARSHIGEAEP